MLAHAGGWDELLIAAAIVLAFMGWGYLRRRRERSREEGASSRCAYCDAALPAGAGRCPACGFRVARGGGPGPSKTPSSGNMEP